jgi:methyltransferase
MTLAILLLTFVTAERLIELWWARRNTRLLLAQGAVEHAPGHYPLIVTLHAIWLLGLWLLGWSQTVSPGWLAVFVLLQLARAWILVTLGRRWTTRILVLPGAPLIKNGPYRFLSHPNYAVVAGEIAVLPLCLGLFWYAVAFSILNAAVLFIRIRAEAAALSASPADGHA